MNKTYMNFEELSRYLGVTITTLRSWVRNGSIPRETYIQAGQTYRFHVEDVEAHLRGLRTAKPKQEEVVEEAVEEAVEEVVEEVVPEVESDEVVETVYGDEPEAVFDIDLDEDA